jgi:RNA polymerase sigma-B factor
VSSAQATSTVTVDHQREHSLFNARDENPQARAELIESKLALAASLARRYSASRSERDDLRQVAALGLIKAVDRFDPARGTAFSSFAVPTITGEIRRYIRDTSWAVHVTRDLQEAALRVRSTCEELTPRLGRSPSVGEIAQAVGWSRDRVVEGLAAAQAFDAESLDAPEPGSGVERHDLTGTVDDRLERVDEREAAHAILGRLPQAQRDLLRMRFDEGLTQSQIGKRLGCSQMHVSRLLRTAIERASILATT